MKLQTGKAVLFLLMLSMSGTTIAAAQISAAQPSSAIAAHLSKQSSALNVNNSSEGESGTVSTAELSLPDAPSATAQQQAPQDSPQPSQTFKTSPAAPTTNQPIGTTFLVANGFLLGSTIANAEFIAECRPSACQLVPDSIRSRPALYGIGIPASLGVTYISYRLRRGGTRLWIVPVALFTAGNIVYAWHASQFSH
jgi:hypothetical protein